MGISTKRFFSLLLEILTMPTLPENAFTVAENADRTDDLSELSPLGQTKKDYYDGDFVLQSQEQSDPNFTHVSDIWREQCLTFEQGFELLAQQQSNIQDVKCSLKKWQAVVTDDDQFAMRYLPTGRDYSPTEHALSNIAAAGKGRFGALKDLNEDKAHATKEDEIVFCRDRRDAEVMRDLVNLYLFQADRVDQEKVRLFRTWDDDNTLRAVLSKDYVIINNQWVLEQVSKIVPDGLLSHWKGNADEIYGNILIPDTIRVEEDSDYGGMLSLGNSEIGTRRFTSCPSVFRAICMNGCIWDQEVGKGLDMVHRKKDGAVDLPGLAAKMRKNLEIQIPLIDAGIRLVLAKKAMGFDGVAPTNVIAAVVQRYKIGKKNVKGIMQAYRVEAASAQSNTAFAVMQALTRYGQTVSNPAVWLQFDVTAGHIARMDDAQWKAITKLGAALSDKDLEKMGVE
jgi:hypothetical protein